MPLNYCIKFYLLVILFCSVAGAAEIDKHLAIITPLVDSRWVGGYLEDKSIQIELEFKPILEGRVVEYSRNAKTINYASVMHIYWDSGKQDVCFHSLDNRGNVSEGTVIQENKKLILSGKSTGNARITVFRTVLEIDSEGKLQDTFYRQEKGKWVLGHAQEFTLN